jgi:diguanylate cyclase (GGDEF)-like protein
MLEEENRDCSREVVHRPFPERPGELTRRNWDEEEKFAKIFRFNPVAMSIISAPDGRLVEVNPEFCCMTGYTREEAIGRTALELGLAWPESGTGESGGGLRLDGAGESGGGLRLDGAGESGGGLRVDGPDALVNAETSEPELALACGHDLSNLEANIRHKSGDSRIALFSCKRLELGGQDCLLAVFRDITERRRMEEQLRVMNLRLREWVGELERRTAEISLLGQMADLLQACHTSEESYHVVADSSRLIFPEASGVLYLREAGTQQMEAVASWGPMASTMSGDFSAERTFDADECWALRLARTYSMGFGEPALLCQHLLNPTAQSWLCVPLMSKGEALGIYHLRFEEAEPGGTGPRRGTRELAQAVAEHIALALGNLHLRETLRQQSTRDSLTGLFNRRHMEESLERELRRAERAGRPLGIILFDLDYFKRFNDTFGHDAGDYLLKELAARLTAHSRKEDIACRYGGEEFLLIMPEASLQTTRHRAEQLRAEIKRMTWECRGRLLGTVTLSCGVSAFPRHGRSPEALLHTADMALYQAKREGRDRIAVAAEQTENTSGQ